ncbi:MAG: tetratricopeptide repeat protein [Sphingopyxis sp.]
MSIYATRGFHKASIKDYEGAIEDYLISIEGGTKLSSVFFNLANSYRNLHRYNDAILNYKKSIEIKSEYLSAWINLSIAYRDYGDVSSSKMALDRAKSIDPENIIVKHLEAILVSYSGDMDRSVAEFDKIILLNPKFVDAYVSRGWSLYQLERFDDALRDLNKAIRLDPSNNFAYHNRAAVRLKNGDEKGGLADLNEAIRLAPFNAKAILDRALLFTRQGHDGEADPEFDRAIRINPSLAPDAYARRGQWWFDKQNYVRAEQDFDKLVALQPTVADWLHLRGYARYQAGSVKEGIDDYDAAAKIDPKNPVYQNSRCWGRALASQELDVALDACNQAVSLSPSSQQRAAFLDSRGRVHLARKEYAEAISDYEAVLLIEPKISSSLYGRGLARKQLNQPGGERDIHEALQLDSTVAQYYSALDPK